LAANNEVGLRKCAIPSCQREARPHRRTCSRACSQLWLKVYRFDTDAQKVAQAKTILANPTTYTDAQIRSARRTLGEDVPLQIKSKLSAEDIPAIRADTRSLREIAQDYGVGFGAIRKVKLRETWKHIP
jgi:hypothetical protein